MPITTATGKILVLDHNDFQRAASGEPLQDGSLRVKYEQVRFDLPKLNSQP